MSEEEDNDSKEGIVEGTIVAVTELVKAVPVYEDAIRPAAKETGKALQTVGRAVNAALMPVRGLVWGFEKIEEFVQTKVAKKLEKVPVENIQTPDPAVAGPALEALRYTGHKESLAELYANLLASSMDLQTAKTAHPGFVEIIRNLCADEAKVMSFILKEVTLPILDIQKIQKADGGAITEKELISTIAADAGCEHRELIGTYLTNLQRLGLIHLEKDRYLTRPDAYQRILEAQWVEALINHLKGETDSQPFVRKGVVQLTPLGYQFGEACIKVKS